MNILKAFILLIAIGGAEVFASEIDTLKKRAEAGNPKAQYILGLQYSIGDKVEKNEVESVKWVKLSADNGDLDAQLYYGQQIPNRVEGLKWIHQSANSDNIEAQTFLGEIYRTKDNEFSQYDIEKSLHWLKKAAERTDMHSIRASFRLYLMFEYGDGVDKNDESASKWLKASLQKVKLWPKGLITNLTNHKRDPSRGTNMDFITNRLYAEMGNSKAQLNLGIAYKTDFLAIQSKELGRIAVDKDLDKAIKWLKLAGDNGNTEAYYTLGITYRYHFFGKNQSESLLEALKYYKWAAKGGHLEAKEEIERLNTYESDPWTKYDYAISRYINDRLEYTWFRSTVSFSKGGDKRLYFSISKREDVCQPKDYESKTSVWEFNKQAISMSVWCNKHSDHYKISATPTTEKGLEFVINTFLKATVNISIEGSGYSYPVSVEGFSKVWNNKSNKVL